ncbi:N-6 DNA methylase [Brevundimonas sp. A19_0]|uniref:N-6 DNA methylase n=1 Tax=Brevundimonas sp. A19_0 TaxID=2821087 RepID=UPI001ADC1DFB|nr:N-6 DNA methylase [Brevundimonas sp. A19_0]MBO9500979.1 N-6 DNA methylase [Brevundimonas sp. A19_0]
MANEELIQRGYVASGSLKGERFGQFEMLNVGATTVDQLVLAGVEATVPLSVDYPFSAYKPPKRPGNARPDRVYLRRDGDRLRAVATGENKAPKKFKSEADLLRADEQAYFAAAALGVHVAITSDGSSDRYIDVQETTNRGVLRYFDENRDFNPAVLQNLLAGDAGVSKDPKPLAEAVWQSIWHATKAEPKECLLTFTEIFTHKFLSDNLSRAVLPEAYRFHNLLKDPAEFMREHGITAIEYYFRTIRPKIIELFPAGVAAEDSATASLFGLPAITSPTSIVDQNAFFRGQGTLSGHNRTFLEILEAFERFGPLTEIDPEFKERLYETFLRRSARQQRLGQFFTPRNVVRPMVRMAQLDKLRDGAVLLDPAAGVGGFILEPLLLEESLPGNIRFVGGRPNRRVRAIGIDVDPGLHMLAKSNMLIHLAEALRDPDVTIAGINTAMAETFVLMNGNETLGSLENPPRDTVDVILTNPPYVTQGSAIYKREIEDLQGSRNGLNLRDYYNSGGLGVEALFMRYMSGALRPGGRAFAVVPLGMLNRTDPKMKEELLKECNLLASIQLPRNTFFNTAQKTAILVLEKRRTKVEARPPVICAIARSIGETLDWRRIPTPDDNDLDAIATAFVKASEGDPSATEEFPFIRSVPADQFGSRDRWDVTRFWSDAELVELGVRDGAISRGEFVTEAQARIEEIAEELTSARTELDDLTHGPTVEVTLNDTALFNVRSGTRVRTADVREHPGDVPIYSCFKTAGETKGSADREWLEGIGMTIESAPIVTVNANGASVGKVYVRDEVCAVTDDVIVIDVRHPALDVGYVAVELRSAVAAGGFLYEAKLFVGRVKELRIKVPVTAEGTFDIDQQRKIAAAVTRFEDTRSKLAEVGEWSESARVA